MDYSLQKTSVWSFPDRGCWATHKGDYRGNWSPHIPRNLILKYTNETDLVLDCFVGSGTTMIECKELNRNGIGIDINPTAISITKQRISYQNNNNSNQKIYLGNAKKLDFISNHSIDFICTHPPYADIIRYSDSIPDDISLHNYNDFLLEMRKVAEECYRVLKPDHYCAFMIGDIRKNGNVIPLGFKLMEEFCKSKFELKEIIIKEHNDSMKRMYLLAHEYIFVMKK